MFGKYPEYTEQELKEVTDDAVLATLVIRAGDLSYYNAAEAPQWGMEAASRKEAMRKFGVAKREADRRGLKYDLKGYLV